VSEWRRPRGGATRDWHRSPTGLRSRGIDRFGTNLDASSFVELGQAARLDGCMDRRLDRLGKGSHFSQFLAVGPANAPASPVGSDVTTHPTATTTNGRGLTSARPQCRCWRRSSGAPLGSRCRWIRGSSGDARCGTRWRNSSSTSALIGSSCPPNRPQRRLPPGRHRLAARACSWRSRRATTGRRREAPVENGSGRPLDPRAQDTRCRGLESARAQEMFH
jgi:hypothetical protein